MELNWLGHTFPGRRCLRPAIVLRRQIKLKKTKQHKTKQNLSVCLSSVDFKGRWVRAGCNQAWS